MSGILKHDLMCVPLLVANTDGTINSNSKSALLGILSTGVEICTAVSSPYVSNAMRSHQWTCTNSKSEKAAGCRTFSDYADIFSQSIFSHFTQGAAKIDVVFDRYIETQSIKSHESSEDYVQRSHP